MSPAALGDGLKTSIEALAGLLDYPGEGFEATVREARSTLEGLAPSLARTAAPFLAAATSASGPALEETFARTFDWSATCGLEVGWHLWGEQYERGAFLVAMRARLRAAGIEEGSELPDHLGSCLRWLARAEPGPGRAFAREVLAPALVRIRAGLAAGADAGYAALLLAVEEAVAAVAREEDPPGGVR